MKPRMFIRKNMICKKHFNRKNWVLQGHFNLWQSLVMKTSFGIRDSFIILFVYSFVYHFEIVIIFICLFILQSLVCLNGDIIRKDTINAMAPGNARFLMDSVFELAQRMNHFRLSDAEIGLFCAVVIITPGKNNTF